MLEGRTSTLAATERALRPVVLLVVCACGALLAFQLATLWGSVPLPAFLACALPALALVVSNVHYQATHALPTVGMIPVAALSLLPCSLGMLSARDMPAFLRGVSLVLVLALLVLLGSLTFWFVRLRRAYRLNPLVSPDAALIVLGGAIREGRPTRTVACRLDVAARYWRESPERLVVVSGGPIPDGSTTEAEAMASYLREQGVDHEAILLERCACNTHENILLSTRLLKRQGFTSQLCVVSSDYHLWRALRLAQGLGVELTPIAAPTPRASLLQQWCREVLTVWHTRT